MLGLRKFFDKIRFNQAAPGYYIHRRNIAGKDLAVHFNDRLTTPEKEYEVSYTHGGNYNPSEKGNLNLKDGVDVLSHVHSTIQSFVREHKPKSLYFDAYSPEQEEAYKKYAPKLEKSINKKTVENGVEAKHTPIDRKNKPTLHYIDLKYKE